MSENDNWNNLGDRFVGTVSEALSTGDFTGLNELVTDTTERVVSEARRQADAAKRYRSEHVRQQSEEWKARQQKGQQNVHQRSRAASAAASVRTEQKTVRVNSPAEIARQIRQMAKVREDGKTAGVVCTVFGSFGIGVTVLMLVGALFLRVARVDNGLILALPVLLAAALGVGSVALLVTGLRKSARASRIEKYLQICGYKMYGQVEELARKVGKSVRFVRRDLRKILQDGVFPEGHLDTGETCLMLNDAVYNQYLQLEDHHRQQSAEQSLSGQVDAERRSRESELNAIMAEGMEYIRRVRDLNDQIPDEKLSQQMYEMEGLLKEIFNALKEHPDQLHRMRKLMEYYLPTTIKLLEGYRDFDKVSAPDKDILDAKKEIGKTLELINQAYREILNSLFRDAAWDVTTDAQVLQSMLAREGLTRDADPLAAAAQTSVKGN